MKRWKVYLCATVFLLLTAVKMVAPAAAADAREVLLPAITICFIGALFGTDMPLTVVQILWVNIIMDTFAACLPPHRCRHRTNNCGSICPP